MDYETVLGGRSTEALPSASEYRRFRHHPQHLPGEQALSESRSVSEKVLLHDL
jgi:hypothetical protein